MTSRCHEDGVLLLDGPIGTELAARGVSTRLPLWSAIAIDEAPDVLAAIHRDYAAAGAEVHTACTFRTQPRWMGPAFERAAREAVRIARASIGAGKRVAGSIAPVEDCYQPEKSPGVRARAEHRALARVLADAGVDLLLCETFPHGDEALVAVEEAVATGLPTWLALTAGPDADLLSPEAMRAIGERAASLGAQAVLVNCVPALETGRFVEALRGLPVPIGAYANAGRADDRIGWQSSPVPGARAYVELARGWIASGATLVGGCCGTSPQHIAALARAIQGRR